MVVVDPGEELPNQYGSSKRFESENGSYGFSPEPEITFAVYP